jgi:hypothetical protein
MQAGAPIVPLYVMLVKLKLTNTYAGLILPSVAGGLPILKCALSVAVIVSPCIFRDLRSTLHRATQRLLSRGQLFIQPCGGLSK